MTAVALSSRRHARLAAREDANPLPRSVTRRGDYALLDGEWRFELDPDDRGLAEAWQDGRPYEATIRWPGAIEDQLVEAVTHSPRGEIIAWYERDFTVPVEWAAERIVQLTFGACGYETRVWLNGQPLRTIEGEEIHLGEYTSFTYELPADALRPVNRLTVRVLDSLDAEIPRGKQASHVYKRGGIWYQTSSGGLRSVWIEPVDRNRLRSRLDVRSSIEERLVEFIVTARIHDPGPYVLRLTVTPRDGGAPLATREFPVALPAGETRQRVTVALPSAALWSPERPNLYSVEAELIDPTGRGHAGPGSHVRARFGLRKIACRGQRIELNNRPLYLDGILYQPGGADYDQVCRHLRAIKALGCNLVRIHIAGVDPRIYDLADEIGLLVWVEVPSPHSSSERSRANHRAEVGRMLPWIGSHPAIVIWSLYNEDWGAEDIAASPETRAYIAAIRDELRRRAPQVLIVDNDGWNHVSVEGELQTDLLTAHIYTTRPEDWCAKLDRLVGGEHDGVAVQPLAIGDPFFYAGQLPLVVSEWGGFGFSGYGGPSEDTARAELIRDCKRALRERAIAGDIYTQATDIEDERNGIIDFATGVLKVPAGILSTRKPRRVNDDGVVAEAAG